jgi:uncharacterized protein YabE (DUF348 family)
MGIIISLNYYIPKFIKEEANIINNFKDFFMKIYKKKYFNPIILTLTIMLLCATIYLNLRDITVVINGKETNILTFKKTVVKALADNNITIGPKDKIDVALDSKIYKKEKINIKRAVNVTVAVDDKELTISSAEDSIGSMLNAEGITLRDQDKLSLDKTARLTDGIKVEVIRVDTKVLTDTSTISYGTVVKTDSGLANTQKRIIQDGQEGEKKTTFSVTYENGKEIVRKILEEIVSKKPIDKIVVLGTYPSMPVSRGGDPIPFTRVVKMRATAYSTTGFLTATGRKAVRNPDGYSTIAVDPSIIPYGTKLFVQGYGFAIAADTGSAIIGNTIDVFFNTYQESVNWAVKYVNVYILN